MKFKLHSLWAAMALCAGVGALHAGTGFVTLASFTYTNAPVYGWGYSSEGKTSALIQGEDGNFYGTTAAGGTSAGGTQNAYTSEGNGTLFKITPEGAFTTLHLFGNVDGSHPDGNLIAGPGGAFYGTTYYGGHIEGVVNGTVFKSTTSGAPTTFYTFGSQGFFFDESGLFVWSDGRFPAGGLVLGRDGNFYGTTSDSGSNHWGTIFKLTPGGILTTLHSFVVSDDKSRDEGWNSFAELVEGNDGVFYGTTTEGGAFDGGTIFKITSAGEFTKLISLDASTGSRCNGGLVLGRDGSLFGAAEQGGNGNAGTIFRMTKEGVLTTLYHFAGKDGAYPHGGLILGSDGNLFGTTSGGGDAPAGYGTVFQMTTEGSLTTLHSFSGTDGIHPQAALAQGKDGFLYGTTTYGGAGFVDPSISDCCAGYGTIFRLPIGPMFQSVSRSGDVVDLTWSAMPGQRYQLQTASSLSLPTWTDFGAVVTANSVTASAAHSTTGAPTFYRVVLL